jgi:hypothetical protein
VTTKGPATISEYQYYEFVAVDRALGDAQMKQLRALSTRAQITPTSFVNTYHWGSFGGDPRTMVERYFDAFLYDSNWGTRQLMFRLPARLLDEETAGQFCFTDTARTWRHGSHTIIDITLDEDGGWDFEEDSETWLSSIIPARAELAGGDHRLLYLAWLLAAQQGDLDDDEIEPPVPPGLGDLSGALHRASQFLRLDQDILEAAAQASPRPAELTPDTDGLATWIAALPGKQKDAMLLRLARGEDPHIGTDLVRRFRADTSPEPVTDNVEGRTVGELLYAAGTLQLERERRTAQRAQEERRRREQRAAEAAGNRRAALLEEGDRVWARLQRMIDTKKPAEYDAAVSILTDLQAAAHDSGDADPFEQRLRQLRDTNGKKPSLIARLDRASLGTTHAR